MLHYISSMRLIGVLVSCTLILTVIAQRNASGQGLSKDNVLTIQSDLTRNRENHIIWDLSNASNGKAVWLEPKKTLSLNFCLRQRTRIYVSGIRFSNGNLNERVIVEIDKLHMGSFETPKSTGQQWNTFLTTGRFRVITRDIGWHTLVLKFDGVADGFAVDKIDITVLDDHRLSPDIFSCELTCIPESDFNIRQNDVLTEMSFMVQESYKTSCPEVDNINIPIFNPSVMNYEITAALPQYRAFSNWREANNTGCPHLSPFYWTFRDLKITSDTRKIIKDKDKATLYFGKGEDLFSKISVLLIPSFNLEGKSKGMVDSEMGTYLKLKFKRLSANIRISMRYIGRTSLMSNPDVKLITPTKPEVTWNAPDFTWNDKDSNYFFLDVSSNSSQPLELEHMFLERRPWLADEVKRVYKDDNVIVEVVFSNFWWLNPDSMTVHLPNGESFNNVSYYRIYRPIPWTSGYAQVFVMYQDGNARLLPVPPEGVDWIPFGSSVIIGQTDPTVVRPYASITDARIDIERLSIDITYKDRGSCKITLVSTLTETRAIVSDIFLAKNPLMYPFTTFRSMYVSEGNTDVDSVSINGIYSHDIMENFGAVVGRSFVFHRKCMSRHLNLSPDIYIDIRQTRDSVAKVEYLKNVDFQNLLQRIQNHRIRLWTPRLINYG